MILLLGIGLLLEVVHSEFPHVQHAVDIDIDDAEGGLDGGLVRVYVIVSQIQRSASMLEKVVYHPGATGYPH